MTKVVEIPAIEFDPYSQHILIIAADPTALGELIETLKQESKLTYLCREILRILQATVETIAWV